MEVLSIRETIATDVAGDATECACLGGIPCACLLAGSIGPASSSTASLLLPPVSGSALLAEVVNAVVQAPVAETSKA